MNGPSGILAVITREFVYLNYIEAGLWIVLGIAAAAQAVRRRDNARRGLLILAVVLITFGLSDLIETRTGAWWRPWWLLAWKTSCICAMLGLLLTYVRRRMGR